MAEHEEENTAMVEEQSHQPSFPTSRVKKIMKLDKEITKVNSEALFLITCSTELFLQFLGEKSAEVALEKKKKTVKLDHLLVAVKRHQPSGDFLVDCLPKPSPPSDQPRKGQSRSSSDNKPVLTGTRRIEAFFQKST